MAGEPLDSLDEFFDFAQLEKDNGIHDASRQCGFPPEAMPLQDSTMEEITSMDWQPTIPDDTGVFAAPSAFPYDTSGPLTSDPSHLEPISPFIQDIPVVPQGDDHAKVPSYSWQQYPMPQEGDVFMLRQETNELSRPQRSATITRKPASAKRKGPSTRIPVEARQMLEEEFAANPYPCSWEIDIIAHQANLDVKRVRNWFNNTRARKKPESPGRSPVALVNTLLTSFRIV